MNLWKSKKTIAGGDGMPSPAALSVTPWHVQVGDGYAATYVVCGYPAEVGPAWLDPLLSYPGRVDVAVHLDPVAPQVAAPMLKRQRARLESSRRLDADQGRLGDPMVEAAAADAADLAERVARGAAKLFDVGIYVTIHARTLDELATVAAGVKSAAASVLLDLQPATFRHQQGWISHPAGRGGPAADAPHPRHHRPRRRVPPRLGGPRRPGTRRGRPARGGAVRGEHHLQRGAGVEPVGAGQPQQRRPRPIRRGQELLRQARSAAQPLPGHGGQSIIDPEDEYAPLAEHVGGTVVQLGQPGVRINPLDLPADQRPDTLTRRGLYLHTLISVMLGASPPPAERAALDRAITATYRQAGHQRRPGHLEPARAAAAGPGRQPRRRRRPGRRAARRPARARGRSGTSPACSTGRPPPPRPGIWWCGRCGTCPTNSAPSAHSWPWTRSGRASTPRPRVAAGGASSSWSTRPGC